MRINLTGTKHDYLNLYMYCKITTVNSQAHKITASCWTKQDGPFPAFPASVTTLLVNSFCHLIARVARRAVTGANIWREVKTWENSVH